MYFSSDSLSAAKPVSKVDNVYILHFPVLTQRCTSPGCHFALATRFGTVAPNICASSMWNLLRVAILAPRIVWWFLDFWKICVRLACVHEACQICFSNVFAVVLWAKKQKYLTNISHCCQAPMSLPNPVLSCLLQTQSTCQDRLNLFPQ